MTQDRVARRALSEVHVLRNFVPSWDTVGLGPMLILSCAPAGRVGDYLENTFMDIPLTPIYPSSEKGIG